MKIRLLIIVMVISVGVLLFFNLTTPSTFDFLMTCPDGYWAETLFCYPENTIVDTAAFNWIGRFMMINDPIIFDPIIFDQHTQGNLDNFTLVKCTPSTYDSDKECTSETIVIIGENNTVAFLNTDDIILNLVSDYQPFWNMGILNRGEIYTHTFENPGFHPFHEEPEPWRTGTVIVLSDDYDVDNLPSSRDYDFERMHMNNACTEEPSFCFGIFKNNTQIMIQCDFPIHGCGPISFDNYVEAENEN